MPVGKYPAILGHEGIGTIREIGAAVKDKSLQIGDHVILSFQSCRKCSHCKAGNMGVCPGMTDVNFTGVRLSDGTAPASLPDGTPARGQFFGQSSFSKLSIVAENSVVKCPAMTGLDLAPMSPLGCGYFTGAGTVFNVLKPRNSESIAIFGLGGVGLAALMAAKSIGMSSIVAVDVVDSKLDISTSLGATCTINSKTISDVAAAVKAVVPGGVDYIVDTTGLPKVLEAGIKALGHGGTLALVGVPRPGQIVSFDPLELLLACKRIVGVIEAASDPQKVSPTFDRFIKLPSAHSG